ncbi:hypothetical protein VIGAN_10064400, partial [Vigna angularis var. angularis]
KNMRNVLVIWNSKTSSMLPNFTNITRHHSFTIIFHGSTTTIHCTTIWITFTHLLHDNVFFHVAVTTFKHHLFTHFRYSKNHFTSIIHTQILNRFHHKTPQTPINFSKPSFNLQLQLTHSSISFQCETFMGWHKGLV